MTGIFVKSPSLGQCVFCPRSFVVGEVIYLWHKLEKQTVCGYCAKERWGYAPNNAPVLSAPPAEKSSVGFDSTRAILRSLQSKANQNDPKLRQSGER